MKKRSSGLPIGRRWNGITSVVLRLLKVDPKDEATSAHTLDEVATIVEQSTREGLLADGSGSLTKAFQFTSKTVADVEVPLPASSTCR